MKRILVLGSRGYLGRYLTKHLMKNPYDKVLCIDKNLVDLRNLSHCTRLFRYIDCDEIYQLAANSGNMEYLLSKGYSYGDSTVINLTIIKALHMIDYKGRILFPSSFYATDVENRYGLEKRYNESLYLSSGLDVRIPRLFSVYGPGEKLNSSGEKVTTAFCRKVVENKDKGTIVIDGHPIITRYFLHCDDAILGLIEHMGSGIIECDLAGKKAITLERLINTIIKVSGKNIKVSWTRDREVKGYHPTPNKLEWWEPRIKFEYGIGRLYKWVKNELR